MRARTHMKTSISTSHRFFFLFSIRSFIESKEGETEKKETAAMIIMIKFVLTEIFSFVKHKALIAYEFWVLKEEYRNHFFQQQDQLLLNAFVLLNRWQRCLFVVHSSMVILADWSYSHRLHRSMVLVLINEHLNNPSCVFMSSMRIYLLLVVDPDHQTMHACIERIKKKVAVVLTAAILSVITPRGGGGEREKRGE